MVEILRYTKFNIIYIMKDSKNIRYFQAVDIYILSVI